ncbi:MAG: hypothetical protein IKT39_04915 [Clostridia bacterium]|nr:hypothetical protein [Clostridia bacterium]
MHPIFVFLVIALVLPVACRVINRKQTWISIICALVIDMLMYLDGFCQNQSEVTVICLVLIQVLVMCILSLMLTSMHRRK